jgi:hypothetical protein
MTPDGEMFDHPLGDRLVWVRYRYDEQQKKQCKTVELICGGRRLGTARGAVGS